MRRIIDAKRYDTEAAELVAEWESHHYRSDFGWHAENLYRTANSRWFLYCVGNGSSPYAEPVGGGARGRGERIRPMDDAAVRGWSEERDQNHVLELYFADVIEDA